jgi:hypothetical protein
MRQLRPGLSLAAPSAHRPVWISKAPTSTLFQRAKLWLDAIPPTVLDNAVDLGLLVGRLGLTDRKGNPLCAAVRPPAIQWSAEPRSLTDAVSP